ncbi:unnamed protein product [Dovyalis caffra]|uniref:Receptor-like serine/threonine-protein kinase n=1 Tax=Dovyalis caffra TaxID=77055 RepID=A0AAV1STV4_9ROSI|nr:unnamed protein product [Dovyalis caffra]
MGIVTVCSPFVQCSLPKWYPVFTFRMVETVALTEIVSTAELKTEISGLADTEMPKEGSTKDLYIEWTGPTFFTASYDTLSKGSSLSVENRNDVMTSPSGIFSAGFFPVADNAYYFAIWFNEHPSCGANCTIVWMANRDQPVNGKKSELSLLLSGNLVISDAGQSTVWASNTVSQSSVSLYLYDNGNLLLCETDGDGVRVLWQSFIFPTDTLLPQQLLSKDSQLVSSRSRTNYSSGFYKFHFASDDNVLRLRYDGPDTSSIYWPDQWILSWDNGRSTFNNNRIAFVDSLGKFISSDNFTFMSEDYGMRVQRRLKMDFDGNLRMYSRENWTNTWTVSWQAMSQPCRIHGICGPNSMCNYVPSSGRKCSCLPGFKVKDHSDWSLGCEAELNHTSCSRDEISYLQLAKVEFFGYDYGFFINYTVPMCKELCSQICNCKGFQIRFSKHYYPSNIPYCYLKSALLNGAKSANFEEDFYLKVAKTSVSSNTTVEEFRLDCSAVDAVKLINRTYSKGHQNGSLIFVLWFACGVGVVEFLLVFSVLFFLLRTRNNQGYIGIATSFRKFTFSELKKATRGFSEEIGRGGGGTVYKGVLSDHRVAAIKKLNEANQGEAEFRAEFSIIGKLNHMNLIEMWGYCAEGKHRLLVYSYMEHGSLADNLASNALDWQKRFEIAVGTAKGLAYLHEECVEWVLHCDVKPQNILLDSNYQPKVSDFGLSRPLKRGSTSRGVNSNFSMIRGTRGYMAPEWVFNLPITSKVDVYSYGIVLLEIASGKSPAMEIEHERLVTWVREKEKDNTAKDSWIEMIADPKLEGKYDKDKMEILVMVALKCVNEDKDARPTMRQVVEMLLPHENGSC